MKRADEERRKPLADMEQRLLRYQQECDERARKDLEAAVERVRTLESDAIRAELEARHRGELEATRRQALAEAEARGKQVMASADRALEQARRREREAEQQAFDARQRALRELQEIRWVQPHYIFNSTIAGSLARLTARFT